MTEYIVKHTCDTCRTEIPDTAGHVALNIHGPPSGTGTARIERGDLCLPCARGFGLLAVFPSVELDEASK